MRHPSRINSSKIFSVKKNTHCKALKIRGCFRALLPPQVDSGFCLTHTLSAPQITASRSSKWRPELQASGAKNLDGVGRKMVRTLDGHFVHREDIVRAEQETEDGPASLHLYDGSTVAADAAEFEGFTLGGVFVQSRAMEELEALRKRLGGDTTIERAASFAIFVLNAGKPRSEWRPRTRRGQIARDYLCPQAGEAHQKPRRSSAN
jgi:hypothetical protein